MVEWSVWRVDDNCPSVKVRFQVYQDRQLGLLLSWHTDFLPFSGQVVLQYVQVDLVRGTIDNLVLFLVR